MSDFYISRSLHHGQDRVHDHELLEESGVFVVLAEPGAGKTDLLNYFAREHGVCRQAAHLFVLQPPAAKSILIIDSLDEVARISEEKINEIIVKAQASGAKKIIFASRSYIWDEARTKVVRDCFRIEPKVLRLEPFDVNEQLQLFTHCNPKEDFDAFKAEAESFELTPILGNPQFLQLFADAYIQGGRKFKSKRQIYADALIRLASESTETGGLRDRPPTEKILAIAGEVFAKLLLSGSAGISTQENIGNYAYPYLPSIGQDQKALIFTLNTRLFKPTEHVNKHEPVHRIVAEYCAADYLVKRIENPTNTLSINRCLAIIAPNGAVRSELRGLLGWMASLGNRSTQEAVISLDPYAVFANGDPSQLQASSKQHLLAALEDLAKDDPYFRRMDSWRKFSTAGFFSDDIAQHVRSLLAPEHSKSHLRGLLLQLLHKTDASRHLQQELRAIVQDPASEMAERKQAYENLEAIHSDHVSDFDALIVEGSIDSLKIASEIVMKEGSGRFGVDRLLQLTEALANLYPTDQMRDRTAGTRYFIKRLIPTFSIDETVYLLDKISERIICTCGQTKHHYQCTCRIGRSKIVALLLDRYFEGFTGPHDRRQITRWTKPLVFRGHSSGRGSAVQELITNHGLRRSIQIAAFEGAVTHQEISDAKMPFYMSTSYAGLLMQQDDKKAIVDHAFETENYLLWEHFIPTHSPFDTQKRSDSLKTHMRQQARQSAVFLKILALREKRDREQMQAALDRFSRPRSRYQKRAESRKQKTILHFQQNRQVIESGKHWWWLKAFAQNYLHNTNEVNDLIDDLQLPERALLNCFDFLMPHLPTAEELIEKRGLPLYMVFEAACLVTFRRNNSLEEIPLQILEAIKVDGIGGSGYRENELERFEAEVDRLLFSSDADKIAFVQRYIEPQLQLSEESVTRVYLLDQGVTYNGVKGQIALDWLTRYPNMPSASRDTLFGIAAGHADRTALKDLVNKRCDDSTGTSEVEKKRRKFWLLRHFFFITPTVDTIWAEFSSDPKSILLIENYAGRFSRRDGENWPQLSAEQVYLVLDAFILAWPKVHLPDMWGTGDPEEETAYRFLTDIVYQIGRDNPSSSIPVFDKILSDPRFSELHNDVKSQRAVAIRQQALAGFTPPAPTDISKLLDENKIASVEDMRAVLIEQLDYIQRELKGAATNPVNVFYNGQDRVDENTARDRIVEKLQPQLNALNLGIVVEHHMSGGTRCDFTATTPIKGAQTILVTEVKGQWHSDLYNAASTQLADRYTIYPGAADQGLYLVLWFGNDEAIAGKKDRSINSAIELRQAIIKQMPENLIGRIDVYVLDVSRRVNK